MRPAFLLLAFVVFLGLASSAQAADTIVRLSDSKGVVYLNPGIALSALVDPTRAMTIGDVTGSQNFGPLHGTPDMQAAYWLRFTYTTAGTTEKWLLFLGYKPDTADFYTPDGHGGYTVEHSGIAIAYADRAVRRYGAVLFYLPPAVKPLTVYVRITTRENEPTIAIDSLSTYDHVNQSTFGIIVGLDAILVSLLISSLVFYATSRDPMYLLYAIYVITEFLYRTNDQGFAGTVFWPHLAVSSLRLGSLFDGMRIFAAMIFLRYFLNLVRVSRWLDGVVIASGVFCGLMGFGSFIGLPIRASWLSELSLFYVPMWIIAALIAWRQGEKQARLIAVGWSLLMLFSVSFGLKELGFGRGNLIIELLISQGRSFGVALQTLFLSLAISTDISRLMRSRQYYESLAASDPLTGLANRRTFEDALKREWNRSIREQSSLSILLVDVDFFKAYNDAYGHAAGDLALRFVADRAGSVMRNAGDLICRYGGDEFVVILPATDEDVAMLIGERIHAAIVERRMPHTESPHGIITVSVGVASTRPTDGRNSSEVFEAADLGLYTAKQLGRNCCATANTTAQYMVP